MVCTEDKQKEAFQRVRGCRGSRGAGTWSRNRAGTPRLEPWHPEGRPTCRAKPPGIDAGPYMINGPVAGDKCDTVYVTYFKTEETQHFSFFRVSFSPFCGKGDHVILP